MRACRPKRCEEKRERKRACALERERPLAPLAPLFICFLLPLGLPYVNWASQESCWFCLRSSLWCSDLPLFYFCGLFPSFSFSHVILDSFFLFYLHNIPPTPKRWEAQLFGNRGVKVFLATSCWTGMARGIGPSSLASLRPQSSYSSVHLRMSDIFCGQL